MQVAMANLPSPITSSLCICLLLLFLNLPVSTAVGTNVLLTGDTLLSEDQLTYGDYSFIMQGDCNLVLYHDDVAVFQSNTHGNGDKCSLTLDPHGRLIILSSDGTPRWNSTTTTTKEGNYAAVLRPDGEVVVYGPEVWSSPDLHFVSVSSSSSSDADLLQLPMARMNVMFSSQVMYGNASIGTRDYSLVMREDCDLALVKAMIGDVWGTGTTGKGKHCFLRLDHGGRVAVVDDRYRTVWKSKGRRSVVEGEYVLVMQFNGKAVIYGPAVWSTLSG